ncbi:MAG: DUF2802 domain-containing protein [Steroidobacteraceae bacterium]
MEINTIFQQNELAFYGARAAVLALALLAFAFAFGRWRRTGRQDMQRLFSELDESRGATRALSDLAQQLAAQINALQTRVDDRQLLAAAAAGAGQRGYDLARQMARNGASAEDMISASGVTRHEAALLARLHSPSPH